MVTKKDNVDTFTVELRGLTVTKAVRIRIERAIRRSVMKEIAAIDHDGTLTMTPLRAALAPEKFGSHTAGMILQSNEVEG
jgi:hypothetical protein